MKIKIKVTNEQEDGSEITYEVIADGRDVRKYEEHFETSWIATELSMTQVSQLAWVASRRQGLYEGDWASFDKINTDTTSSRYEAGEVESENPT